MPRNSRKKNSTQNNEILELNNRNGYELTEAEVILKAKKDAKQFKLNEEQVRKDYGANAELYINTFNETAKQLAIKTGRYQGTQAAYRGSLFSKKSNQKVAKKKYGSFALDFSDAYEAAHKKCEALTEKERVMRRADRDGTNCLSKKLQITEKRIKNVLEKYKEYSAIYMTSYNNATKKHLIEDDISKYLFSETTINSLLNNNNMLQDSTETAEINFIHERPIDDVQINKKHKTNNNNQNNEMLELNYCNGHELTEDKVMESISGYLFLQTVFTAALNQNNNNNTILDQSSSEITITDNINDGSNEASLENNINGLNFSFFNEEYATNDDLLLKEISLDNPAADQSQNLDDKVSNLMTDEMSNDYEEYIKDLEREENMIWSFDQNKKEDIDEKKQFYPYFINNNNNQPIHEQINDQRNTFCDDLIFSSTVDDDEFEESYQAMMNEVRTNQNTLTFSFDSLNQNEEDLTNSNNEEKKWLYTNKRAL